MGGVYREVEGNNVLLLVELLELDQMIALVTIKDDYLKSALLLYNSMFVEVLDLF